MTTDEKLGKLSILVGSNVPEDILLTYLNIAKEKVLNRVYPFERQVDEVPIKYEHIQLEVACYILNKRGAEGETSHNENGVSRSYASADVPDEMFNEIVPYGGLIK